MPGNRVFRFSLKTVLKYRRRCYEHCERVFAQANSDALTAERELRRRQHERLRRQSEFAQTISGQATIEDVRLYRFYLKFLDNSIADQEQLIEQLHDGREKARLELLEADKAKQSMEKLRQHRYRTFLYEERRAEQQRFDERAMFDYVRAFRARNEPTKGSA